MPEGILLIDKPVGISSFGVIKKIRWILKEKKVGHAGTLDPFASGLLIVALGRAYTKQLSHYQDLLKCYRLLCVFGIKTDTADSYGQCIESRPFVVLPDNFLAILQSFIGKQLQRPPYFSAKKVNGKRAYKLARLGLPVTLNPSSIEIFDIKILDCIVSTYPQITLEVVCSKGTYIRTLVEDIAEACGCIAYTRTLRRFNIGEYSVKDAVPHSLWNKEHLLERLMR